MALMSLYMTAYTIQSKFIDISADYNGTYYKYRNKWWEACAPIFDIPCDLYWHLEIVLYYMSYNQTYFDLWMDRFQLLFNYFVSKATCELNINWSYLIVNN